MNRFVLFLAGNGDLSFQDVTPGTLEKYRLDLVRSNLAGESITTYLQSVRKLFAFLEDEGVIFANPAVNFKNPRLRSAMKEVPSEGEMTRLLTGIDITTPTGARDRAMIETAYCCALRMNEMLKLTVFSVDFDDRTLRVFGKGARERMLPLGAQAVKWLKAYMAKARPELAQDADTDTLWLTREGRPMAGITYQKMLHHHAGQAGLAGKISGHTMRRACATHMLRNGAHPVAVQHMLGHGTLQHLSRYLNLSLDDLRKTHGQSAVGR